MSFKDFVMVERRPGMDDHINYMVQKRRRLGENTGCCPICCDCAKINAGQTCQCDPCNCCTCETETNEALTFQQRKQRARSMRKYKAKIAVGRAKAKRRSASPEKLLKRARKLARTTLFKKLSKGKSKNELPFQRRHEIEKRLDKMKGRIDRMSKKNIPVVRKLERDRRSKKSEK